MHAEYLLFNLFVLSGPLFLSFWEPTYYLHRWKATWLCVLVVAVPYIMWDMWVAGSHWFFNEQFTLGFRLFGLPLGELLFFVSVPFACLFSWETLFKPNPRPARADALRMVRWAMIVALPVLGGALYLSGKQYTGLVCFALASGAAFDLLGGADVLLMPRFYGFLLLVVGLTLIFNGYLTARPVVTYGRMYQLDFRIFTIPVEDFFYGISHILWCASLFEAYKLRFPSSVVHRSTHLSPAEAGA